MLSFTIPLPGWKCYENIAWIVKQWSLNSTRYNSFQPNQASMNACKEQANTGLAETSRARQGTSVLHQSGTHTWCLDLSSGQRNEKLTVLLRDENPLAITDEVHYPIPDSIASHLWQREKGKPIIESTKKSILQHIITQRPTFIQLVKYVF